MFYADPASSGKTHRTVSTAAMTDTPTPAVPHRPGPAPLGRLHQGLHGTPHRQRTIEEGHHPLPKDSRPKDPVSPDRCQAGHYRPRRCLLDIQRSIPTAAAAHRRAGHRPPRRRTAAPPCAASTIYRGAGGARRAGVRVGDPPGPPFPAIPPDRPRGPHPPGLPWGAARCSDREIFQV